MPTRADETDALGLPAASRHCHAPVMGECPEDESVDCDVKVAITTAMLSALGKLMLTSSAVIVAAMLTTVCLRPLGTWASSAWAAASALALIQAYCWARVHFDAEIFSALGARTAHWAAFDRQIQSWRRESEALVNRSLDQRVSGARKWLRRQGIALALQAAAFGVGWAHLN
jgi:hypothetical protein